MKMMRYEPTDIPGCYKINSPVFSDERGTFCKSFNEDHFLEQGFRTDFRETYYSRSVKDVIRGFHFQVPPADHAKLVSTIVGSVLDVVLDIRVGSPTFGRCAAVRLDTDQGASLYIPSGCAHGFAALSDEAILLYQVTSVHSPGNDSGIRWDSVDFTWPIAEPILSDRDRELTPLSEFNSPFRFTP